MKRSLIVSGAIAAATLIGAGAFVAADQSPSPTEVQASPSASVEASATPQATPTATPEAVTSSAQPTQSPVGTSSPVVLGATTVADPTPAATPTPCVSTMESQCISNDDISGGVTVVRPPKP